MLARPIFLKGQTMPDANDVSAGNLILAGALNGATAFLTGQAGTSGGTPAVREPGITTSNLLLFGGLGLLAVVAVILIAR